MKKDEELYKGPPSAQELRRQKKHWVKKMLELKTEETLFTLSAPPPSDPAAVHTASFELPGEIGERLRSMSGGSAEALFLILLTGLKCVLHKHTGGDTITVAYPGGHGPASGHTPPAPHWIPLIDRAPEGRSFREWLYALQSTYTEASRNSDYPQERLAADMKVVHDRDYAFLNHVRLAVNELHGETDAGRETTGLLVHIGWHEGRLRGVVAGNSRFFTARDLDGFSRQYCHTLGELIASPDRPVEASGRLPVQERERLLNEYASGPVRPFGDHVMTLIEEQFRHTPQATAIIAPNGDMNYSELQVRVRRWTTALLKAGTKRGDVVALYLERSAETAVAILAAWSAGACILPMDVQSPAERVKFMLDDAGATRLITHARSADNPLFAGVEKVLVTEDMDTGVEEAHSIVPLTGDLPAYIIYTSGTTGNPKGVAVDHRGLANSISWRKEEYGLSPQDSTIQLFSYSFDGFMTGFLTPLVSGASLVIATDIQVKDPLRLKQLLTVYHITHFICVPSLYRLLLEQIRSEDELSLRSITLAGESVAPSLIRDSRNKLPEVEIINEYGPTEASIVAVFKRNVQEAETIAIGRPVANMNVYILDDWNEPVPPGIPGELCLSGPGLAEGYLNRSELNAQAFAPHPFIAGERIYRTGDLAKWSEEGEICCLGRKDAQIKLRGYRIELPEIEQRLEAYPGVQAAAVLCEEEEDIPVRLAAYLQAEGIKAAELREYMAGVLPFYMLPARYYRLDRLPLSDNGKLDKKALLSLEPVNLDVEYREPENETESQLCEIFADVLQLKRVSTDESFFSVGGHSLKATMLMSRIQKVFGVEIGIDDIFEKQTVQALAAVIDAKETNAYPAVMPAKPAASYPLSFAQKRMYTLFCRDPHSIAYNMPEALIIDGDLDRSRLGNALKVLTERHEILRTTFRIMDGEPVQVVHPASVVSLEYSEQPAADLGEMIRSFVRPFDLSSGPLFRAGLTRLEPRKHLFLIDLHHIVADGASVGIFISELAGLYNGDELPEITLQYKDFSVWQHERKTQDQFQCQESYWLEQFRGGIPVLSLPYDYPRPKLKSLEGARISFTVDAVRTAALQKLATDNGVTLFMLLLTVYQTMLSKLSGQKELVVGSPVSGRMRAELEPTMGMFVNVVPIRTELGPEQRFTQLLAQVKNNALGAFEHQAIQYEELVHRLDYTPDTSRNPLFDTLFVLQNMAENRYDFRGLHFSHVGIEQTASKFDLTLAGFVGGDNVLYFDLEYCSQLFRKETALRFADYFMHILQAVINDPGAHLSAITLLPQEDLHRQWSEVNGVNQAAAPVLTFLEQYTKQVKQYPDREALLFGESHMTYGQLDALSDRWAGCLRQQGIGSEDVVAVRFSRSFELIAAFLAVLKAGGVYLPIDPAFPAERADYMLQDSGAVLLLTDEGDKPSINFKGRSVTPEELVPEGGVTDILLCQPKLNSLAYIIYTSGTTGKPKGVALEHAGLANLSELFHAKLEVKPGDRVLQFAPCSFDASVWEFVMALATGGTLCLASTETIADPVSFEQYVQRMGVTIATLPPAYMARLKPERLPGLRLVIAAGSEPSAGLLAAWARHMQCINAYGPTEASVCAAMWSYEEEAGSLTVPIGFPVPYTRLCIVDSALNPLPAGVSGELCIAGTGLARGYLNQPEMTARQFVSSPIPGFERMYRTGDLARLLPDGRIVYQGRIDSQLKIRGYRVEPGEIEARMLQIPGIQHAVVVPKQQLEGSMSLAAYYTGEASPQPRELKIRLSAVLPNYMLPSLLVKLSALPLTSHGKVDTAALHRLVPPREGDTGPRMPDNETEALILQVFEQVLEAKGIGTEDTFNELGGDSISAMKASFLLKERGLALEVRDLLLHQSAAALGELLLKRTCGDEQGPAVVADSFEHAQSEKNERVLENSKGDADLHTLLETLAGQQLSYSDQLGTGREIAAFPLTEIQARYLGRNENVGVVLPFPAHKSKEEIEAAVLRLVQEQDLLRSFYAENVTGYWSLREQPAQLALPYVRVEGAQAEVLIQQMISQLYYGGFGAILPGSLLYRIALLENASTGDKVLIYASHHSLSDGLSCSLIAETLTSSTPISGGKQEMTSYSDFVTLLEEGPSGIGFTELEHRFELMTYRQLIGRLEYRTRLYPADNSTSLTLEWPLSGAYPEEGWMRVLSLLAVFGREYLQLEQLPVQLVSSGRRYGEHTFYHLVGNFTDYVPVVLHTGEPAEQLLQRVRDLTQAASDHHIRFAALEGNEVGKGILLNYFGAVQGDTEEAGIPDGGPSFEESAAHYGIHFYVRHTDSKLRVDIALPFRADADELRKIMAGGTVQGLSS